MHEAPRALVRGRGRRRRGRKRRGRRRRRKRGPWEPTFAIKSAPGLWICSPCEYDDFSGCFFLCVCQKVEALEISTGVFFIFSE